MPTTQSPKPPKVIYHQEAYNLFQTLKNGLANAVIDEIDNILATRQPDPDGTYRVTEADVRKAMLRALDRLEKELADQ